MPFARPLSRLSHREPPLPIPISNPNKALYLCLKMLYYQPMKKSLIHLPQYKRDELKRIVKIIRRQFPSTHMIILFGSYARGQGVEDT